MKLILLIYKGVAKIKEAKNLKSNCKQKVNHSAS